MPSPWPRNGKPQRMSHCSAANTHCRVKYSAKEYFLALFMVVGFILALRLLLYILYRVCHRAESAMESRSSRGVYRERVHEANYMNTQRVTMPIRIADVRGPRDFQGPGDPCNVDQSLCVILAGEDHPRFIAQPAPLSGFRDPSAKKCQEEEERDIRIPRLAVECNG